jgi:hypothetical protein
LAAAARHTESAAAVLVDLGEPVQAARLHGAAHSLWGELPRSVPEARQLAAVEASVREVPGDAAYEAACGEGRSLTVEEAYRVLELSNAEE